MPSLRALLVYSGFKPDWWRRVVGGFREAFETRRRSTGDLH